MYDRAKVAVQERQKLNDTSYPHLQGGYSLLEKHLRKSKAKALRLESLDLISPPPRYGMWKASQTKFDVQITS